MVALVVLIWAYLMWVELATLEFLFQVLVVFYVVVCAEIACFEYDGWIGFGFGLVLGFVDWWFAWVLCCLF